MLSLLRFRAFELQDLDWGLLIRLLSNEVLLLLLLVVSALIEVADN